MRAVLDTLVAPVSANEAGCDNLHWLDGSIVRPCCDRHDRCDEYYGCTSPSWWYGSWSCGRCNFDVGVCFLSFGSYEGPFYQSP